MTRCERHLEVEAFHDGELDAPAAAAVLEHVAECPACTARLADLRATSALFAATPRPGLSQIALHRLHRRVADEMDRGLVRLAGAFSGIAAGVMLLGSAWLLRTSMAHPAEPRTPETPPPWVGVAVSSDTDKLAADVGTPAAQWYLADASRSSDDLP